MGDLYLVRGVTEEQWKQALVKQPLDWKKCTASEAKSFKGFVFTAWVTQGRNF